MKETNIDEGDEEYNFNFLHLHYGTREFSFGMTTSDRDLLEQEDYLFTSIGKDEYTLVSRVGDTEYQCTGSCFCRFDEEQTRRYARKHTLSKGMVYLLTGVSVYVVADLAERYFDEECSMKFSTKCEEGSLFSEVGSCDPIKPSSASGGIEERKYFCRGHCSDWGGENIYDLDRLFDEDNDLLTSFIELRDEFGCKRLTIEGEISLSPHLSNIPAEFNRQQLDPFCKKNSPIFHIPPKQYYFRKDREAADVHVCEGRSKNLVCRQV